MPQIWVDLSDAGWTGPPELEEISMTFKKTLLSSVAALALALPVVAQTTQDGEIGLTGDGDCTVAEGAPVPEGCEVHGEDATATEMEADTDMEADAGISIDPAPAADLATADMVTDERDISDASAFHGMTVGDIVGMDVRATAGGEDDDVGEIDYVVQGAVSLEAVIGIGGFIGLGEYTVALPLGAFSIDPQDEATLIIDGFTEEQLEAMPEVDESELEALPSEYMIGG